MTDERERPGRPTRPVPKEPVVEISSDEQLAAYERELAELVPREDREAVERVGQLEAAILEYREQHRDRLEKAYPAESDERDL
ncbi:MAG: hypothetical protein GVY13_02770 [Alphaproteobacteria bacterium]|jgi:hypothetical protein|nr:hypothetical protein [Alphaproteobacteria bacterium]